MIVRTTLGTCAAIVAAALFAPANVSAHARYDSSTPGKGAVVAAAPSSVTITFTQDVQKISGTYGIDVAGADGASVTAGEATLGDDDRSMMSIELQPNLPVGRYVVNWKNVSDADGDAAEGAFSFYVGVEPTETNLAADEELAAIGGEDETPAATSTSGETPEPTVIDEPASATPDGGAGGGAVDDGDTNVPLIVVGAVVVLAVVGGGVWLAMRRA